MHDAVHPAARYEADVQSARRRASGASVALGLTIAVRLVSIPIQLWQVGLLHAVRSSTPPAQATLVFSDTLVSSTAIAQLVLLVVTGVLFLRWLHLVTRLTRALGGSTLRWVPKDVVWAFILPFVSFARPYQVVRDVHDHLAPDAVPEPPIQVRADDSTHYRQVNMVAPPPPAALPHASIGAWWGFFWVGNVLANIAGRDDTRTIEGLVSARTLTSVSDAVDVVSAALAVVVVRGVTARLNERFRRVRHTPVETLRDNGIIVG